MKRPLVSIIIPVYNRVEELRRALRSVLNQTINDFEVLVIDDGSDCDFFEICNSFQDDRIRLIKNEKHTNANVARNVGLHNAKGEYVAMLDSDDEFLENHIERRLNLMQNSKCDGIFGSAYIFNGKNEILKLSRPLMDNELMINYLLSEGGFAQTSSHFYKTSCAREIMWDESLLRHQDFDFCVRFSEKYHFISDYEPTIRIHWATGGIRNYDFDSCINFIHRHIKSIKKRELVRYSLVMARLAIIYENKEAYQFYMKPIRKHINYVSLQDWLGIDIDNLNRFNSVSFIVKYHYHLLFHSVAKMVSF